LSRDEQQLLEAIKYCNIESANEIFLKLFDSSSKRCIQYDIEFEEIIYDAIYQRD